jgi:hypothetical protein
VGGSAPESFETIVARYAAASPLARPGFGGKLRAIGNVLRGLLTRKPDLRAIEARLEVPSTASARLAADSPRWRDTH